MRRPAAQPASQALGRILMSGLGAPRMTAPRAPPTDAAVSSSSIGLLCRSVTAETAGDFGLKSPQGLVITGVVVGSPAHCAGIHQGDVILKINGKDPYSLSVLPQAAAEPPRASQCRSKSCDTAVIR